MKPSNTTSAKLFGGLFAAMLGLFMLIPAHGQFLTVQMTGTVTNVQESAAYWDSSVQAGTNYTLTFTLEASETTTYSGPGDAIYNTGGSATISSLSATLGDYTFSTSAVDLGVRDLDFNPSAAGDLLIFGNNAPFTQNGLTVYSGDAFGTVIGGGGGITDTSLNSVNEVNFSPTNSTNEFRLLSGVFNINSGSISGNYPGGTSTSYDTASLLGNVTSYSVLEFSETPEPSTWALMLGGLGLLFFWRMRTNRALL